MSPTTNAHRCLFISLVLLFACAERPSEESIATEVAPVLRGTPASPADFPSAGAVVARDAQGRADLVCSGVLLTPDTVLTAAHCFSLLGNATTYFSLADRLNAPPDAAFYETARVHLHPAFSISSQAGLTNDLAIAELIRPIEGASPAILPSPDESEAYLKANAVVTLVGYGATDEAGTNDGNKNVAQSPVIAITDQEITVGDADTARNCTGDSGGPAFAVAETEQSRWLLSIVSRSLDDNMPCVSSAVVIRVDAHLTWIDQVIRGIGKTTRNGGCTWAPVSRSDSDGYFVLTLLVALAAWHRRAPGEGALHRRRAVRPNERAKEAQRLRPRSTSPHRGNPTRNLTPALSLSATMLPPCARTI